MSRRILPALALGALAIGACEDAPSPTPLAPEVTEARVTPAGPTRQVDIVPGRVLARFTPGAAAERLAGENGARVERTMALGIRVLSVAVGAESRVAAALARNPNVEFAETDVVYTFGEPSAMPVDDPFIGYKWDLDNDGSIYNSAGAVLASTGAAGADMDWREAVEQNGTSAGGAVIGIVDSGIRHDHQELQGRILAGWDFFADDGDPEDDDGHGTHVAGIAAADADNGLGVAGVAFAGDVRLVVAKVCGPSGRGRFKSYGCPSSAIADGIVFAVDNGAHVINISLGGGIGSSATQQALQYARANDVLPFCAAGNDAGPVSFPAAFAECVAVSATNWSDGLASYSNFGSQVELAAPGGDVEDPNGYSYILSSYNGTSSEYAFLAGTSMASPQAAGAAALLHAFGTTGDEQILQVLKSTADDLGAPGTDGLYGAGRINLAAALAGSGGGGNGPPVASFDEACVGLECSFTDTSSDGDGHLVSWSWDFGDGNVSSAQSPTHTYLDPGTYIVELSVTDDDGATSGASRDVTVSVPGSGGITLQVTGYKAKGLQKADLTWTGATSATVDVYRGGELIATTANDGAYTDPIDARGGGSYTYTVCEADTGTCSAAVTIGF